MNKHSISLLLCSLFITGCNQSDNTSGSSETKDSSIESINESLSNCDIESESIIDVSTPSESLSEIEVDNRSVIILGIDGAGNNINKKYTPNIMKIFEGYATSDEVITASPTITAQCWGSLLTGVSASQHKFTNDSIKAHTNQISNTYPSIFKQIRNEIPDAKLASFCTWNHINHGIVEDDIDVYKDTINADNFETDFDLAEKIVEYLQDNNPKLLFSVFDNLDGQGHATGFNSEEYYAELANMDFYVGAVYNALEKLGRLDDTLFIVTADHGGNGYTHTSGSNFDNERLIFFGAKGKNINNGKIGSMNIKDVPAIVATHLGINRNEAWSSKIPANLFKDIPGERINEIIPSGNVTPKLENGLYSIFNKEDFETILSFDDNITDSTNKHEIIAKNDNTYQNGIFGKAINITNKNFLTIKDLKLANKSFTISSFVNINSHLGDPCLFSNKDWNNGLNDGIVMSLRNNDIKFNLGRYGTGRFDATMQFPNALKNEKWLHILLSYDYQKNQIAIYINFELEHLETLSSQFNFDSSYNFNIGQDGTGVLSQQLDALIDEFLILNKSFTKEDVDKLKEYYSDSFK